MLAKLRMTDFGATWKWLQNSIENA